MDWTHIFFPCDFEFRMHLNGIRWVIQFVFGDIWHKEFLFLFKFKWIGKAECTQRKITIKMMMILFLVGHSQYSISVCNFVHVFHICHTCFVFLHRSTANDDNNSSISLSYKIYPIKCATQIDPITKIISRKTRINLNIISPFHFQIPWHTHSEREMLSTKYLHKNAVKDVLWWQKQRHTFVINSFSPSALSHGILQVKWKRIDSYQRSIYKCNWKIV